LSSSRTIGPELAATDTVLLARTDGGPLGQVGAGIGVEEGDARQPLRRLPRHFDRDDPAHRETDRHHPLARG
jgi:hypothetical protein